VFFEELHAYLTVPGAKNGNFGILSPNDLGKHFANRPVIFDDQEGCGFWTGKGFHFRPLS
jgi:hypothetical protein